MPERIQLSRKKGWRMPPNTVKVCRPTIFGNPWSYAEAITPIPELGFAIYSDAPDRRDAVRAQMVAEHRRWLLDPVPESGKHQQLTAQRAEVLRRLPELRGKNLACWCKPGSLCHADVLLELANKAVR